MNRNAPNSRSRRAASLGLTLSCVALVAGCKPGEEGFNPSAFLSPFAAPGPVSPSVLSAFFADAMLPGVVTRTAALFDDDPRYNHQSRFSWRNPTDPNEPLNGRVYNPLRSSGAAFAHAAGVKGVNTTIAVSDDQYLPSYDEFANTTVEIINNWEDLFPENGPATSHGTITSAVALGESNDFIGIAPDANLMFGTYETEQKLADLGNAAAGRGAVAWNNSWGYTTLGLNQTDFNFLFTEVSGGANYLSSLDNYASQGVVVFSASNNTEAVKADLMAGLPFLRPSLEAGWIAAVNGVPNFTNGNVVSVKLLSSPCLEAARWCLIADGTWRLPDPTLALEPSRPLVTGTSFAAPQISGALALLQEAFPGLNPHQLRVRLLASAEDGFFAADDTVELATGFSKGYSVIYGLGFLDIEAALKPIGATAMTMANGASISTDAPLLRTGTGFGDAVERSLAGTDVLVKDALSAGFVMPAGALTSSARPGSRAAALLSRSLTGDLAQDRTADVTALNDQFASFGGSTMDLSTSDGLSSASVLMPQSPGQSVGVNLTRALTDGSTRVELGLKLARDDGRIMSLDGENSAMMASVSLGVAQDLGENGFIALSGEVGMTDLGGTTAISGSGSARFDSAALKIGGSNVFAKGDRLTLGVAMPMAVSSGERMLNLPVHREAASASFEQVALNLAPENRQVDLEIGYQAALSDGLEMKLSVIRSNNFGNRAGEVDSGGAIGFTFSF